MKKRPRLLFLSQVFPLPADGGGKIKTLNSLLTLAKKFEITAVFISEARASRKDREFLKSRGIACHVFFSERILDSVKDDLGHLLLNFLQGRPHYLFQYTYQPAFSFIDTLIKDWQPEIIHVDHLNIAQYLPKQKRSIEILEHHNVESHLLWTRFLRSHKLSRKIYLFIESMLTYLLEKRVLPRFDHIFAISEQEVIRTKALSPASSVSAQPLVYPMATTRRKPSPRPSLVFVGSLGWPPNEDAMVWFITKIFPHILSKIPTVQLHVIGKSPEKLGLSKHKTQNVKFYGYVKNIDTILSFAWAFVLPFRMGGGVRIKGLTALAHGLPIISTQLGVEGLQLIKNQTYLLAETEQQFAAAVVKILTDHHLRNLLIKNGYSYLRKNHQQNQNAAYLSSYVALVNRK